MKVIAATLLTLLVAPSTYAANTRRLGAADNQSLSMDLIESAAVEPADYYYYEGAESKSGKSPTAKSEKSPTAKSEKSPTAKSEKSPTAKSGKSPTAHMQAAVEPADYYYYEGGESKSGKSPTAKSEKSPTAKSEKSPTAKSEKSPTAKSGKSPTAPTANMQAAVSGPPLDGIPEEVQVLIEEILAKFGEMGVDMAQADAVDPAFHGDIIQGIIEIVESIFGYSGSKSGKGSKSGDHDAKSEKMTANLEPDYYYYEGGESKSGKSPTAKSEKSPTAKSGKSPTAKSEKSPTAKSLKVA